MFSEKVIIDQNPALLIQKFLTTKAYSQVGILVDEHTANLCYPKIKDSLPSHKLFQVPSGEENKTLYSCTLIWQKLTDNNFDRHSLLIILGGGVLGDMGGFCAATYKRGIDFVLMPTTLLGQVDASVGGKLGIDFQHFKNHIGVFQEPVCTLISTEFLGSLPHRELRSGYAEVIKHCLIADSHMWEVIRKKPLENQDWEELITHSVKIKYQVITEDPREKGLRKILNFGHTIGHALETYFLKTPKRLFHGEAIAIGMIAEAFIGEKKGLLTRDELSQITGYLVQIFGKEELPHDLSTIIGLANQDKKNKGDRIYIALPKTIGKAVWDIEVTKEEIEKSLNYYQTV
jgi:3-dehydroquinate synthase